MTIFFLERFYKEAEESMLTINPIISNIRNINLLRPQQNKVLQQPKQNYPNLRPLAHDCVSFTSSKKLNRSLLEAFDNKEICIDVHKNADVAEADFSPMIVQEGENEISLSEAKYAARVKIDEEGCEAAAFTVMLATGAARPPEEMIDFVLNRPFLFVINGQDGQPLFVGVVNQPK